MIQLPENFFEIYWQKKPCLLKAATDWRPEITPDELAGIACEEDSKSRIIMENTQAEGAARWHLEEGPFEESDFSKLSESHWTLLVKEVDAWDEQVAELLTSIPIIPQWRIQDVMVSYAVDQGSVGPHFDFYDVFLVQGMGKRLWKLGQTCDENTERLDHQQLLLLKEMQITEEHLLEPGDILYIPPGVSHWGLSQGECMTFSIGFRAPSAAETLQELNDLITPKMSDSQRYQDSEDLLEYHRTHDYHHQLSKPAIESFKHMLMANLTDANIAKWLGSRTTESEERLPLSEEMSQDHFEALWSGGAFDKHPQAKMAWFHSEQESDTESQLFCNGQSMIFKTGLSKSDEAEFLQALCEFTVIDVEDEQFNSTPATKDIIRWLLEIDAVTPLEPEV